MRCLFAGLRRVALTVSTLALCSAVVYAESSDIQSEKPPRPAILASVYTQVDTTGGSALESAGAVGISQKFDIGTIRAAIASNGSFVELSGDLRKTKSLAALGLLTLTAEARGYSDLTVEEPTVKSLVFLEAKGALGGAMAFARGYYIDAGYAAGTAASVCLAATPIGYAGSEFVQSRAGLYGLGGGLHYGLTETVTLIGEADMGWNPAGEKSIFGTAGAELSGFGPGIVGLTAKGVWNSTSAITLGCAYSLPVVEIDSLRLSLEAVLAQDEDTKFSYALSYRHNGETYWVEPRLTGGCACNASVGMDIGFAGAINLKLSADYVLADKVAKVGISARY